MRRLTAMRTKLKKLEQGKAKATGEQLLWEALVHSPGTPPTWTPEDEQTFAEWFATTMADPTETDQYDRDLARMIAELPDGPEEEANA